jgi:hypothetical protein
MDKNYKKFHDCFVTFLKRVKKFPAMNLISNKFTHLNQAHCDHLSGSLRQPIIILGIQLSPILIVNIQNNRAIRGIFNVSMIMVQANNTGKPLIRKYLPSIKNARQISCIDDLNSDILHIPDISPVHLF